MMWFRDLKQTLLNGPFLRYLSSCDVVLAHNKDNAEALIAKGVTNVYVIYDPIPQPIKGKPPSLDVEKGKYIIVPVGWDSDEPFDYLISELGNDVLASIGFKVVITGNYTRTRYGIKYAKRLSKIRGVVLTGYLPYEEYARLLNNATAVLGLTNSEHIMLRAFWEAATYYKPVIAPRTKVTVEVMKEYPYYYKPYKYGSLRKAVKKIESNYDDAIFRGKQLASHLMELSSKSVKNLKNIKFFVIFIFLIIPNSV